VKQSDLRKADFFTPLFGPVLRLDSDINLAVSPTAPDPHKVSQWSGLQTSNQLLSTRFPSRRRNYQHHVPKTLTKAALDEVAVIWADEIAEGARSGFSGAMDVDVPWLATWHGIERWREALLWVWTVVTMGAWGSAERQEVFRVLELEADNLVGKVVVHVGKRESLASVLEVIGSAGWDKPSGTTYTFCECLAC
jgi:3-O-alpha-D-mannopyranosyl-alpha-D-mannopyranose xylosylphosphotransferase